MNMFCFLHIWGENLPGTPEHLLLLYQMEGWHLKHGEKSEVLNWIEF